MPPAPSLPVHPPSGPAPATNGDVSRPPPRSQKSMTKAERRELQEKQRAAKAAAKANGQPNGAPPKQGSKPPALAPASSSAPKKPSKANEPSTPAPPTGRMPPSGRARGQSVSVAPPANARGLRIFSHFGLPKPVSVVKGDIHPAILRLALQFSEFKITGANARCIATLLAFKTVCSQYISIFTHTTSSSRY